MTDAEKDESASLDLPEELRTFVEDFAFAWGAAGNPRMDGRVLGLLLIVDRPFLSSAQIAEMLGASAGAVSMSTRALVSLGFLKPHSLPGDRSRYFRVEEDVWGSFLAGERDYARRITSTIEYGLDAVSEDAVGPRTRLNNARRYMVWLVGYHRKMLSDWEAYRDSGIDEDPAS